MLIKNALIYGKELGDIKIKNGKIIELGKNLKTDDEIIDANGFTLIPSFIDLNINLKNNKFSLENLENLENECLKGGVSTIILRDKMNFDEESFSLFLAHLNKMIIKVFPSINVVSEDKKLKNISTLISKGALALELQSSLSSNIIRQSMQYALMKNIPLFVQCYDEGFDDYGVMNDSHTSFELGLVGMSAVSEISELAKMKQIANFYQTRVVFDCISLKKSLDLLDKGDLNLVSIHHLLKDDKECKNFNTAAKLMPPLRGKEDIEALKEALKDGKISFLSSLHSPKSLNLKDLAFDEAEFGIHSVCEYISLCYTFLVKNGFLSWEELCDITSFNQAKFLGLNCGKIKPKMAANLVIFDENEKYKLNSSSLYGNDELFGKVKYHIINGKIVFNA